MITLLHGDCREVLGGLPERSVQCVVTSPPYWGLRRYDVEGDQIGIEPTPAAYVAALCAVFDQVRRVMRDDGTCWVVIGDSYSAKSGGTQGTKGQRATRTFTATKMGGVARDIPEKNLIGIPWRVAFALQDRGWILRSDIIWAKPNCMPESVTDRPTRSHEYVFLFAKQARYFYDADAIREPLAPDTLSKNGIQPNGKGYPVNNRGATPEVYGVKEFTGNMRPGTQRSLNPAGRNARTVWTIPTRPLADEHYAAYPEELARRCILAGSSPQACEVCSAPWARVVERDGGLWNERKAAGEPMRRGYSQNAPPGAHRVGGSTATTTGFAPTCACPDATGSGRCVVLDPFAGSGTTLRVAESLQRNSIGIDLGYQELQMKRTDGIQIEMVELR